MRWDASHSSVFAGEWALARAEQRAEPVQLLQAISDDGLESAFPESSIALARARGFSLIEQVEAFRARHPLAHLSGESVDGDEPELLCESSSPEVLVVTGVGRPGRENHQRELQLAIRLVSQAGGPVAVIPEARGRVAGPIVVGVDETGNSDAAIEFAAYEAHRTGEPLVAVHAVAAPATAGQETDLPDRGETTSPIDAGRDALHRWLEPFLERYPHVNFRELVEVGERVAVLRSAAREASMLVIGRGHDSSTDLLRGTAARLMMTDADRPLVVVPASREAGLPTRPDASIYSSHLVRRAENTLN